MSGYRAPTLPAYVLGLLGVGQSLGPQTAEAAPMDAALGGLVLNAGCSTARNQPCEPDRGGFARLVAQYGAATMPPWATPAATLGARGLRWGLQVGQTSIDRQASYWRRGTRGGQSRSGRLNDGIGLYALTVSKGLGFGLDASALVGRIVGTGSVMLGGRLQFAPFEGWDVGPYAWLPDVAVALSGWSSMGPSELTFSGTDWELRLSKPLPVAPDWQVSPWLGLSRLIVRGQAQRVDLTPSENALRDCVYRGPALPGASTRSGQLPPLDGAPICAVGDARAFDDSVDFGRAQVVRHRVLLGAGVRFRWLVAALQAAVEPRSPAASQSRSETKSALGCQDATTECSEVRRQWSWVLSLALGL